MFFGVTVEVELDKAGHKASKEERRSQAARQKVLDRYLGSDPAAPTPARKFADPMKML